MYRIANLIILASVVGYTPVADAGNDCYKIRVPCGTYMGKTVYCDQWKCVTSPPSPQNYPGSPPQPQPKIIYQGNWPGGKGAYP